MPFFLLTADPGHESINALSGRSDALVRAGFLYWNTLPFALGLPGFVLSRGFVRALRGSPPPALVTFVAPAGFVSARPRGC